MANESIRPMKTQYNFFVEGYNDKGVIESD